MNYAVALIVGILLIAFSPRPIAKTDVRTFIAPPDMAKHFVLGYNDVAADMLWLRVVQDIDVCEKNLAEEGSPLVPLGEGKCEKGWVFHMLDVLTELAPKFRIAYSVGGTTLSVIVQDKSGADLLLQKGIKNFPNDWNLKYKAAYHAMAELNDPLRAAQLLTEAGKLGAPGWVFALAGKLLNEQSQSILAKSMLEEALKMKLTDRHRKRIEMRLEEVNRALAQGQSQSNTTDQTKSKPQ